MSRGINKVLIIGNVGKDPEVAFSQAGTARAKFSVATTEKYKDRDGNKVEDTSWHNITAFGKLAEIIGEYVKKGAPVYIEGRIKYSKVTGSDGIDRYYTDIIANEMQMIGGGDGGERPQRGNGTPRRNAPQPQRREVANTGGSFDDVPLDDDIPFVTNRSRY